MITEDYVSFETAKLLKKKGFDERTDTSYIIDNTNRPMVKVGDLIYSPNTEPHRIAAPTLQMAMKWLRNVHNLHIRSDRTSKYWNYTIRKLRQFGTKDLSYNVDFNTYEQACESAIKYCLENLI